MKIKFLFAFLFFVQSTLPSWSMAQGQGLVQAPSAARTSEYHDTNSFLQRMGYEDFAGQIDITLMSANLSSQQQTILKSNQERLKVLNSARELAAFMSAKLSQSLLTNAHTQDRYFKLITKLLTTGPSGLPDELPPEIQNIKNQKEKLAQTEKFLQSSIEDSANQYLLELKADFFAALYTHQELESLEKSKNADYLAEKKFLVDRLAEISMSQYSFLELAQTKFLGRALALSSVRKLRQENRADLENSLRLQVAKAGSNLDNDISSKYSRVYSKDGKEKSFSLKLNNGDILTSYNRALEKEQAPVKIYPLSWLHRLVQLAKLNLGLQNMKVLIPMNDRINVKRIRGERLTWLEKIISFSSNLPLFRRGYNTAGLVQVRKDKETGLASVWIYRNIGNDTLGGVQIEDTHNFLLPGLTDRIGHSRLNAKALADLNSSERFSKIATLDDSNTFMVKSQVAEDERASLLSDLTSQEKLENGVAEKALQMMKKMMTGSEVVGNNWGVGVRERLLSSGQSLWLAFKAGAGINIQSQTQGMSLTSDASAEDRMNAEGLRAVGASTWLWDSSLAKTTKIELPKSTAEARMMDIYGTTRASIDSKVYALTSVGHDRITMDSGHLQYVAAWTMNTAEMKGLMARPPTVEKSSRWQSVQKIDSKLASTPSDNKLSDKSMRSFLIQLGFDDRSSDIQKAFDRGDTENASTKIQQERNIKSYDVLVPARELSILLMNQMQGRLNTTAGQKQIAELSAYLLSLQPQFLAKKMPNELKLLPKDQQDLAFDKYTKDLLRKTMDEHTRNITSDLLWNLLGDEALAQIENKTADKALVDRASALTKQIYNLSAQLVERMYMDNITGQTRYAGRAFVALAARQAEVRNAPKLMEYVAQATSRYGYNIKNFLGTEWAFSNPESKNVQKVKVSNLSMVLNRDMGPNGAIIPSGALPHDSLVEEAKKNGLVSKFGILSAMNAIFSNSLENLADGDGYSTIEQAKDKLAYNTLADGYSHIGYVAIKEAKDSNVKMTWVYDNYPTVLADHEIEVPGAKYNSGGLRFVGLEQFYLTSIQSKFMVANPDAQKFFDAIQKYIKKNGKPKTGDEKFPFKMIVSKIDENGKPIIQDASKAITASWPVETSQETLDRIFSITDPQQFYDEYTKMVLSGFDKEITRGMTFQWITPYGNYEKGSGYCSSTLSLIALKYFGVNPEILPGQWHKLLGVVDKVYTWADRKGLLSSAIKKTIADTGLLIMARMGIIPPSSLAGQEYMTEHVNVQSPAQEISSRMKDDYSSRIAKSRTARGVVDKQLGIQDTKYFAGMRFDPSEVRSVTLQTEEGVAARLGKIRSTFAAIKNLAALHKSMKNADRIAKSKAAEKEAQTKSAPTRVGLSCQQVFN